jgi:hypothetical protein
MPSCAPKLPVPADRSHSPVDYSARSAFLNATTNLLSPAPIDDLLKSLPTVHAWLATIPQTAPLSPGRLSVTVGLAYGRISTTDHSSEAAEVKRSISDWMKNCQFFCDGWRWIVEDYAELTLLLHAFGRCERRKWYRMEPWEEFHPEPIVRVPRRGNESNRDYKKRFDEECRRQSKEILRPVQLRTGALTLTRARDARWTVRHLCLGETFVQIAEDVPKESGSDENKVGKAVRAFRRRAGLLNPPPGGESARPKS